MTFLIPDTSNVDQFKFSDVLLDCFSFQTQKFEKKVSVSS